MSCKKDIIKTMKKLYKKELISVRDGNVSFKPKNEDCFFISAGSVKKHLMSEDQVIKVNFVFKKAACELRAAKKQGKIHSM